MRIISGEFKGRKLVSFKGNHIRPTTDRTKESIFNKLQSYIGGSRVLDLFSGTGSLGLEALSRGASWVEMVDNNKKSLEVVKKNIELLGVNEMVSVVNADVVKYCQNYKGLFFDIIFLDPPFTKKIAHESLMALSESRAFSDDAIIVIESGLKEELELEYLRLCEIYKKLFSDKRVSFYGVNKK